RLAVRLRADGWRRRGGRAGGLRRHGRFPAPTRRMPGAAASRESRTDQPERTQWFTDPRTPVRTRRGAAPGSPGGAETGGGRLVADAAGRSLASVPCAAAPRRALRRFLVGTTASLGTAFEPHPQRRLGELGLLRGATAVGPRQ